ncbi:TRAP transporter large permease [Maritalea porphyrae]|jgi:C4-dicarboxylate transporter DctM subunit|uniref:TRAP transporter large permease n=1 Tax=Maritalea porphyrae TaxID=880732 RepID=UPI0022AEB246|nr:TRAP transporter large permease [Maritalea porphyrae]MCZ4271298.1 TRAP transporter large permease [Maritalea porphyrae]
MSVPIAAVLFIFLLVFGAPIFLVLGMVAGVSYSLDGRPLIGLAQKIIDEMNSPTLVAVPLFVMAARVMDTGGISRALIDAASTWVGQARGGLAFVCVVTCTIFAAISGSSVATALAMAVILVPAMASRGYPRPFTLGVIGASGTLGILIPPSLPMIVYAVITDTSIARLFLAGVIPGLLQAGLFMAVILFIARKEKLPREPRPSFKTFVRTNRIALPALMLPVIVLGGIYSGIVTVSEAAGLSTALAILLAIYVYRQIKWSDVPTILAQAIRSSATIMIIVAMAFGFSHWLTETGLTRTLLDWVTQSGMSKWQFLLVINVILLMLGMILEVFATLLLTLPLIVPIMIALEIDPVHFAIMMIINMELGLLTPPIGLNLFVLANASKAKVGEVVKGVLPFIFAMLVLLILITFIPTISTFLPNMVYGVSK